MASSSLTGGAGIPKFRYLSAWFCPYAHRATLALEHHRGRVEYEWVEALGWRRQEDKDQVTGNSHEWHYHWKADELKRANPSALVPTVIPIITTADGAAEPDESRAVYESVVVVEYVDAESGADPRDRLVPSNDPYQAARCRIWTDKVNRECCSPYYGVLVRKEEPERREHFDKLVVGLKQFSEELRKTDGPLFLSGSQLSIVDLTLFPWAYRYYVLEHYRGPSYRIPTEAPELQPYWAWYRHMLSLPPVQRTLPDPDRYLDHILKYADGSARSKVANAVRRGAAAHELDDAKDEY